MLVAVFAAMLLSQRAGATVPQFQAIPKTDIPAAVFAVGSELCDGLEAPECRRKFVLKGAAPGISADFHALQARWFDASRFPSIPAWSRMHELDDPMLKIRWVATFKGGVYSTEDSRSFSCCLNPSTVTSSGSPSRENGW